VDVTKTQIVRTLAGRRHRACGAWLCRGAFAWLTVMTGVASRAAAQSTIDLTLAREYFADVRAVAAHSDTLWRIRSLGALLFVDPSTRQLVANVADSAGLLTASGDLFTGTLPGELPIANTALVLGGRRFAMMMWPLPPDRSARLRLLFHESFHRIQPALGLPAQNPDNAHLNTMSGRVWTRLEWRALAEALLVTGPARRRALRDAIAFRAMRLADAGSARADEQALLINEGLAEYSGWRAADEAAAALPRRIALAMVARERQPSFVRSFAYAAGPAYGLLLDQSGRRWRHAVTASSDVPALLMHAYRLGRVDTTNIVKRSTRYGGLLIRADETEQAVQRETTERALRERFVESPVLVLPVAGRFNYSFDPTDAVPIADHGTVYNSSDISDVWGTLRVTRNGVLLRRGATGDITAVVVPVLPGSSPPVSGSGWTLELSADWMIRPGERRGDWIVARR
jgi:hypothetical protein